MTENVEEEETVIDVSKLDPKKKQERSVFVKNLNFSTTDEMLEQVFKEGVSGGRPFNIVSCKIVRDSKTQLSRGYGFVEFDSRETAERAIKKFQNFQLEDHALKLSVAGGKKEAATEEKEAKKSTLLEKRNAQSNVELAVVEPAKEELKSNKLIVKNLAFETTEGEIKELFKAYGAVKKVRLPKKVNSKSHRGFGFVEFVSAEEAKNAFKQLQHTHLYGRKLIIEWAKPEDDALLGNSVQPATQAPQAKRMKL